MNVRIIARIAAASVATIACGCATGEAATLPAASTGLSRGVAEADSLVSASIGKLTPGAVLLVAKDGKVLHERAFGYAQLNDYQGHRLATPRAMTVNTLFDLASVTKVMATTFAVMMLVDRGEIDVDAPVYRYLPDFRGPHLDSITVRHLLQHSSGLVQWQPLYYQASNSAQTYQAIRKMPLGWGVGEGRHYSDLGFMLIGFIVERVSGKPLDQFVDQELYKPLGLKFTTFNPRKKGLSQFAATEQGNVYEKHMVYDSTFGYRYNGNPRTWDKWRDYVLNGEVDDGNSYYANGGVAGHAGLFSNASEIEVLLDILNNRGTHAGKRYLSAATIDRFLTVDKYNNYLGWQTVSGMPYGSFMHTGFTGTYVMGIPKYGLSVVLLTNRQNLGTDAKGYFPDIDPLRKAVSKAIADGAGADAAAAGVRDPHFEPTDFSAGNWYKGNTHTHTSETDGDSPPEVVATWYKSHGYNFLVLSDHEILLDLSKISHLEDSTFRFIPGEEITGKFGAKPVHLIGINISRVLKPIADTTAAATVQRTVDSIRAAGGVPQINHPNFGWALTEDDLMEVKRANLVEIHNGHPLVNNEGGGDSPGMEAVWDYLLSHGKRIYGVGSDDAHHFKTEFGPKMANPGKGWVTVRATKLDPATIVAALDAGHFYASSGVELDSIVVKDADMKINIRQYKNFKYTTQFVGDNGVILKSTGDNPATFHLSGKLTYVRAKISDSNGATAWTQPVFVAR